MTDTSVIENQISVFIHRAYLGDSALWQGRNLDLAHSFFKFLGFMRYCPPSSRPDSDPKWTPPVWCAEERGYVSNVRVATVNRHYAQSLIELAEERNSVLPNGWPLAEVISALFASRKHAKKKFFEMETKDGSYWSTTASISKYLLNTMYPMIGYYGGASKINICCHDIVARGREKIVSMIKTINKTAVVLYVNTDEIVYCGDQVEFPEIDVHHEKFNTLVFTGYNTVCYGNGIIRTGPLPRIRMSMDEEFYFAPLDNAGDRCRRVALYQKGLNLRVTQYKASLTVYLNLTKEDIDRKYAIDSECDSL